MSTCNRWTVIPNAADPGSVPTWHFKDLAEPHKKILLSLLCALPDKVSVDGLGSTETVVRMSSIFSALTGVPTLPSTLFAALVAARKAGEIETRSERRRAAVNTLKLAPAPSPEVPA